MFFFFPFISTLNQNKFVLTYCTEKYASLVSRSLFTCLECILMSGFLLVRGSKNRTISMTIILCLIIMIFSQDLLIYLKNASEHGKHSYFALTKKLSEFLHSFVGFWYDRPYITAALSLVISNYITRLLDLSLFFYISYIISNFLDSAKLMYLGEYGISSCWSIMIISAVVVWRLFDYLRKVVYSLFYSVVGSTLFLIATDILFGTGSNFPAVYMTILKDKNLKNSFNCLMIQTLLILFSVCIQVTNVYK